MIRVAVVVGKMNSGGIKSLIMEYYRHIDKSQVQFDFICDSDSKSIAYDEINSMGGRVLLVAPYRNIFKNMRDIYKLCVQNKYPVIHAYLNTLNPFSLYAAQKAGVPVRISESLSMAHKGEFKTIFKKILLPLSNILRLIIWLAEKIAGGGSSGTNYLILEKLQYLKQL